MKWVVLTAQARNEEDFELLTKMLGALGFQSGAREQYGSFQLQSFRPNELILEVVQRKSPRVYPDLDLTISDPDSAVEIIKKMGLEILGDHSGPEPKHSSRGFYVQLPGGTVVNFNGMRMAGVEPAHTSGLEGTLTANGKTFGIVVSRFNSFITERLLAGAVDGLRRCGVDWSKGYDIVRVPGSFEIPLAARTLAETGKYDAIICLGCLLRGDTAHYDVIVNEVTRGIGQSAQETGVPHAFGVLTCDTLEQAIDRAGLKMGNKGLEGALAAVEMASLTDGIRRPASGVGKAASRKQHPAVQARPGASLRSTGQPRRLSPHERVSPGGDSPARNHKAQKGARTKRK
jgi:6,7-dimethyl-8-ribityllumazine synthase